MKKIIIALGFSLIAVFQTYHSSSAQGNLVLSADFESGTLPTGWTTNNYSGDDNWIVSQDNSGPTWTIPNHTWYCSINDNNNEFANNVDVWLISPSFELSEFVANLSFSSFFEYGSPAVAKVKISTDGVQWFDLLDISEDIGWQTVSIDLTSYIGNNNVKIAFHYSDWGNWTNGWAIDDIKIECKTFTEVPSFTLGIAAESAEWGDCDNDGLLDILLTGQTSSGNVSYIFNNNGDQTFSTRPYIAASGVSPSSSAWGDYDNDGDLDIVLTGTVPGEDIFYNIYKNNGNGSFTQTDISFGEIINGSVDWGDYDNDGDLDLLITGEDYTNLPVETVSKIYRNDGNDTFSELTGIPITAVFGSDVAWGDYDNDGDLDILLTGSYNSPALVNVSIIYRNDGNDIFTELSGISLMADTPGSIAWGDYDSDGDLDILMARYSSSYPNSIIYRNDGNDSFSFEQYLIGVSQSSAAWGDYDNDGDLDVLMAGYDGTTNITVIYENDIYSGFIEKATSLTGVSQSSVAWGDYDNDGDLDILLSGIDNSGTEVTKIYSNNTTFQNYPPTAPSSLSTNQSNNNIEFNWTASTDSETPITGLTYNLRIGTSPGGSEIMSPHSSSNGIRKIVAMGNVNQNTNWIIHRLPPGTYYWSVQAIDNNFGGSSWAPEQSFTISYYDEQIGILLPLLKNSSVDWSDYDNDGNLDFLITGEDESQNIISKIYRNDGNENFIEQISISLPGVSSGSVDWGDYNNDGYSDILISGNTGTGNITKLFENDGAGSFIEQSDIILTGVNNSSIKWVDSDNDGDLDIFITGNDNSSTAVTKLYTNENNNVFIEQSGINLPGVDSSSIAFSDYDLDGDFDILLTGYDNSNNAISKIYRNDGDNNFIEQTGVSLTGVYKGTAIWCDFDSDGHPDISLSGKNNSGTLISTIYKNEGNNIFTEQTGVTLPGVENASVIWGDYDNDGDPDILINGNTGVENISKIYTNDGSGIFTEQTNTGLTGVSSGSTAWGDYDNDKDLDLLQSGTDGVNNFSRVLKNNSYPLNSAPTPPTPLHLKQTDNNYVFSWEAASDIHTSSSGLTYNLRIGTTPGGCEILAPHSLIEGKRSLVKTGNVGNNTSWAIKNLPPQNYYWSIQAIDNNYEGSQWSEEQVINSSFIELTEISLTGVANSSAEWGDYDNDGDLDILLCGNSNSGRVSKIYRNDGSDTFSDINNSSITGLHLSSVAWGDYDNDGDLDILLTGTNTIDDEFLNDAYRTGMSKIYRNDGNETFVELTEVSLTGTSNGSSTWIDYDNDGDLDILLSGTDIDNNKVSKVYRNDNNNVFTEQSDISLRGVSSSSVACGDYDNDGNSDILLTGSDGGSQITNLYKNDGNNSFTEQTTISLTGVYNSSVAWGDYDSDGNLDILLTGSNFDFFSGPTSLIYRNEGNNTFLEQTGISITAVDSSSVDWGDFDNDGYLDILLTGRTENDEVISQIFKNNGDNTFNEQTEISLTGVKNGSAKWGDYDNDRDLDILITGTDSLDTPISKIYKNNLTSNNTLPEAPVPLIIDYSSNGISFKWNAGTDSQTTNTGLSYNLRIGTTAGGSDIMSPHSLPDGKRKLVALGNTDMNTNWTVKLPVNDYYWSVQAIDNNFAGSSWYPEQYIENKLIEQPTIPLNNLQSGSAAWGDYDKDGDLDIVITGQDNLKNRFSKIYKNEGGNFLVQDNIFLAAIDQSSIAWSDFDNNGFLDIILSGAVNANTNISLIYLNDGNGGFYELSGSSLIGVKNGDIATADYDNDGDQDIIITGHNGFSAVSKLYKNDGNAGFSELNTVLITGVWNSSVTWTDYDKDNDFDILISGEDNLSNPITKIYKNEGADIFSEVTGLSLTGVYNSSINTGDYDNDGDPDILLCGNTSSTSYITKLYRNDGNNIFTPITDPVFPNLAGKAIMIDYENDGDLDILLSGDIGNESVSVIYTNNGDGTFNKKNALFPIFKDLSSLDCGDYDNDTDLDLLITGQNMSLEPISNIYKNINNNINTPPSTPTNLQISTEDDAVFFFWDPSNDAQTPQQGLKYNCYLYEIGGDTIWHSLSSHTTGKTYVPYGGNAGLNTSWYINGLDYNKIYAWSVQAINNSYLSSSFAPEATFRLAPAFVIQPINQTVCEYGSITFNTSTSLADSYQWYRFTENDTLLIQNNEYFSNATSPNLTVSNATLEMQGYDLRCAATNIGGTTFSASAILSVDNFIAANAGSNSIFCGSSFNASANLPVNTTGEWSSTDANVVFATINSNSTLVSNLQEGNTTLTWTLTQNNVCGQNSDEIIITSETPLPQASQPTGETNCVSGTLIYETNYLLNADSYTWQLTPSNAGTITGNDVTGTINYNADFYGTGSIRVAGINSCIDTVWSLPLNFTITPTPEIPSIPTGATNLCKGTSNTNYTTTTVSNTTSYQWELLPSAAGSIEGTGTSVSVTWNATFFGTASIKVKAIGCTESNWSEELIVNISEDATVPATPSSPSGNMNLCKGATSNYSINALSNARSYLWEVLPIEAGSISGDGTNSLLVLNEAYIGTASIKVKGANTCGEGIWSPSIDIEIIEAPQTPDIPVGETNLCKASANTNYAILTINNASSYNWELLPSSAGSIEGSGINASVIWNSTFYGNASLKVKAIGCSESNWSEPLNITVNQDASPPETPTSPGGNINLCKGSSSNYNINALSTAISYIWEILPVEAGSITGDDINAVLVLNETYIGPAAIKAKGINTCGEGLWSSALDISISPAPSVAEVPTGETLLCKGKNPSTNYSVTDVSDATFYIWELLPSSAGSVEGSGNNISVIWNAGFSGEASIKVAAQGCESGGWSEELPVTIFGAKPDKLQRPIGSNNLCINSNNTQYQAELSADVLSYDWQISNNAGIITNNNSSAIVDWDDNFYRSAGLRVRGINTCDTSDWSEELLISIKNIPEKAGMPQTDKTELCVDQISSYAIPSLESADYYSWEVYPSLAAYANGTTTDITIDWLESFNGDAYIKVKGVNECGEGLWSDSLLIVINSPEVSDIMEKSNYVLICPDVGYSYQWYLNGNPIIGATKKYYYHDNMPEGSYQVEITDSKGCSTLSENLTKSKLKTSLSETVFIYPNPTSSVANIEIDNDYFGEINLKITNSQGLTLKHKDLTKSEQLSKTELGISDLQPGSYLFEFNFNGDKVIKQVIVN